MYTILTYHTIGDHKEILPSGINTPVEVFQSHMDYLYRRGYRVLPLDEVVDHIVNCKKMNNKTLALTFDDGYEDHFLNVFPILKKYDFPATIFLTVKYINGYWESEKANGGRIKALSNDQILEMQNVGLIQFGTHGYSHNNLLRVNEEEKVYEIVNSKVYLEDMLGVDVPFISYPFGAYNGRIKNIVRKAGYKAAFSIWNKKFDIYSVPRIPLHTRDGLKRFCFKISPFYFFAKSIYKFVQTVTILPKDCIPSH